MIRKDEWLSKMIKAATQFKEAVEHAWKVLESYGVTPKKLEEVKSEVDAGIITRREGWAKLGLPTEDYPE